MFWNNGKNLWNVGDTNKLSSLSNFLKKKKNEISTNLLDAQRFFLNAQMAFTREMYQILHSFIIREICLRLGGIARAGITSPVM